MEIRKSAKICKEAKEYAKSIVKKGMPLIEIAEKIETKIEELGGKAAFPVNLSINEIAAHYTPSYNDDTKAEGLLKVDLGVSVDGWLSDCAFSVDLEDNEENKKLIEAANEALEAAVREIKKGVEIWKIGEAIQNEIISRKFSPIRNLSGHEIKQYHLHGGITIPNYNTGNKNEIEEGVYAIEPFATTGEGIVYDGKPSGIYQFILRKGVRDMGARKIQDYIEKEYKTNPFCSRWLVKKFGTSALMSLRLLEQAGGIKQYEQLIEKGHGKVSQAETTVLVEKKTEVLI